MTTINNSWKLPPEIEARLGENSFGPQRAIYEAGQLLIILHEPPAVGDDKRYDVLFFRSREGGLSAKGDPNGTSRMKRLLNAYRTLFMECDRMYEEANSATDLFRLLEKLAPLNRSSTNLAAALQMAREACKEDKFLIGMRDASSEISRSFDLLVADAKLALDYRIARNAEKQSKRTDEMARAQHKLNILAAFTFPVMAIATLLGMNLTHGLESVTPILFWTVLGGGICIGFLIKAWVMKGPK